VKTDYLFMQLLQPGFAFPAKVIH